MKILNNKNFAQKIIIAIVIMLSFNFIAPTYSRADFGGVLLGPVIDLIAGICDAFVAGLQYFMYDGGSGDGIAGGFLVMAEYFNEHPDEFPEMAYDDSGKNAKAPDLKASDLDRGWIAGAASTILGFISGGTNTVNEDNFSIPISKYSPEKIFAGKVPALDVNFINPTPWNDSDMDEKSITQQLQETISSWYNALRNLVIVGLLSMLLYVGIRMMLTSISSDRAKYKQMLMDWIIALCLVFFLHYIMSFTLTFVQIITDSIGAENQIAVRVVGDDGNTVVEFNTDLMGYCRFQVQYADIFERLIYLIFYIALTVYTVMFTWKYMKRAITMAFLTLMAPLVTLTYPIDKMGDGKAQAFNMWLKEYVFNALLQPFHLIIYTIFLGSAMNIAVNNPVYAILFLAFITPAEKILRQFFKFDKATTAGATSFAGGFGGAAAFNMVKGLVNKGASRVAGAKSGNSSNRIRQANTGATKVDNSPKGYSAFANSGDSSDNNSNNTNGEKNETPQQKMLDAYDEGYGTDKWNAEEREAMAREAGRGKDEGMNYSRDEYAQTLRESGYTDEQVEQMLAEDPRYANNNQEQQVTDQQATEREATRQQAADQQATEQEATRQQAADQQIIWQTNGRTANSRTPSMTKQKHRRIKGLIGAGKGAARYTGEKLRSRFLTKDGWKKNLAFAGRTAVRTVSTGIGLAAGIGMGIAGDDLEDVVTRGIAGGTLGNTVLNDAIQGTGRRIANSGFVQVASQGGREAYYGGVKEAATARQTRQLKESGELRQYISNNITHEDGTRLSVKELDAYEDRAINQYNSGVTEFSSIKKALKLENTIKKELDGKHTDMSEEEKKQMAAAQATTIAKIADGVNGEKLATSEEYRNGRREEFKKGLLTANPSMSQDELKKQSEQMMKLLCEYKKVSYQKD